MLTIVIPGEESFDNDKNEFVSDEAITLQLEHSLVSLSKWESIWNKPFLDGKARTDEELLSYVKAMTLTPDLPPEIYQRMTNAHFEQINAYIHSKMTATWFSEKQNQSKSRETITSEVIYYWMIALNIPFECQDWHLNRLLTLVRICNEKNAPQKPMTKAELAERNRRINAERKAKLNTNG